MMLNDVDRDYIKNNKIIIFLFIIWIFRQLFLLQANEGGVAINKFVVVQILTELGIFGYLLIKKNNFGTIVFFQPITWFAVLYILGMASIFWGVLPIMGCYFAFQNLLMLYAIYFLASKTKSVFQLERYYIFVNIFVLILFFLRSFFMYNHNYHSVSFSTIASLLFVYCITEFNTQKRPPENIKMLKIGFVVGFVFLVLTSSSGAIVSTVCGLFVLSLVAKNPMVRLGGILFFTIISICFLLGATERLIAVFFPNKSAEVIQSGNGRTLIWQYILEKAEERPLLGWGYASVERVLDDWYCTDAHNAIIGTFGSLGYVGGTILILAMLSLLFYLIPKLQYIGFCGWLVAAVVGLINSNTSNFITSKAGIHTVMFQMVIILPVFYYQFQHKDENRSLLKRNPGKKTEEQEKLNAQE